MLVRYFESSYMGEPGREMMGCSSMFSLRILGSQ